MPQFKKIRKKILEMNNENPRIRRIHKTRLQYTLRPLLFKDPQLSNFYPLGLVLDFLLIQGPLIHFNSEQTSGRER